ncbi:MAG: hypothetical protein ACLQIB_22815, partial [Isosphaeraceae bacterium]
MAGLFVAAEFGGRTFLVVVGFCHLFGGLIGDRSDRLLRCGRLVPERLLTSHSLFFFSVLAPAHMTHGEDQKSS